LGRSVGEFEKSTSPAFLHIVHPAKAWRAWAEWLALVKQDSSSVTSCVTPHSRSKGYCIFGQNGYRVPVGRGGASLKKDRRLVQRSSVRNVPRPAGAP